jgi:hypothetical protein
LGRLRVPLVAVIVSVAWLILTAIISSPPHLRSRAGS